MGKVSAGDFHIRPDDLTGDAVQGLVHRHLAGMHGSTPPEHIHAFDIGKLRAPGVTFWSAWAGGEIAGMGALKALDEDNGEIKSMRVADAFLGQGVGRAILDHILGEAKARGMTTVWLETGTGPAFEPAAQLYRTSGFALCGPFGDYAPSDFNIFMSRRI